MNASHYIEKCRTHHTVVGQLSRDDALAEMEKAAGSSDAVMVVECRQIAHRVNEWAVSADTPGGDE